MTPIRVALDDACEQYETSRARLGVVEFFRYGEERGGVSPGTALRAINRVLEVGAAWRRTHPGRRDRARAQLEALHNELLGPVTDPSVPALIPRARIKVLTDNLVTKIGKRRRVTKDEVIALRRDIVAVLLDETKLWKIAAASIRANAGLTPETAAILNLDVALRNYALKKPPKRLRRPPRSSQVTLLQTMPTPQEVAFMASLDDKRNAHPARNDETQKRVTNSGWAKFAWEREDGTLEFCSVPRCPDEMHREIAARMSRDEGDYPLGHPDVAAFLHCHGVDSI
jgi:hypothetical protein